MRRIGEMIESVIMARPAGGIWNGQCQEIRLDPLQGKRFLNFFWETRKFRFLPRHQIGSNGAMHDSSVELVRAFLDDDDSQASQQLYDRYRESTMRLADQQMSLRLQTRVDAEDVYQSVSLILFEGLRDGRFQVRRSGDLRALLAELTRRRVLKKAEQNQAACRNISSEQPITTAIGAMNERSHDADHVDFRDMLTELLSRIPDPRHRLVLRLAAAGEEAVDIAAMCCMSRTRASQILGEVAERAARMVQ